MATISLDRMLRDLIWLISESDPKQVYADRWGMLLRRVRHETDIRSRQPNEVLASRVNDVLSDIIGKKWPSSPHQNADLRPESIRTLLCNAQTLSTQTSSDELSAWWEKNRSLSDTACKSMHTCDDFRCAQKECNCFPCPRFISEVESHEISPEAFIYRLNQPSPDNRFTQLGCMLKEFCSPDVFKKIIAVYFTYYFPGSVFDHKSMGWVSIRTAKRSLLADSWNFIHWATKDEMDAFYSPSHIIRKLKPDPKIEKLVDTYWIISKPFLCHILDNTNTAIPDNLIEEMSDLRDAFKYLVAKNFKELSRVHSIRRGFAYFVATPSDHKQVSIRYCCSERSEIRDTELLLNNIIRNSENQEKDLWLHNVNEGFLRFAERIFGNRWRCQTYIRFPVLPEPQMWRGADVFLAMDTSEPDIIFAAIKELTEPLCLCASLIGGKTGYKAAEELELDVSHHIAGLLRHEVGHRLEDIQSIVRPAVQKGGKDTLRCAIKNCAYLTEVLHKQLSTTRLLGLSEPDDIPFSTLVDAVNKFLKALPAVSSTGFKSKECNYLGFSKDDKVDSRILLLCILLLHNAQKHSTPGLANEPPGVTVTIEKDEETGNDKVRVTVESWFSTNSPSEIRKSMAIAKPIRPSCSFDAVLALSQDLNSPKDYRPCITITERKEFIDEKNDRHRWRIAITYVGRFSI